MSRLKTYAYTKMCTAALLITAKDWKRPRCPSTGEYENIGTTEYFYYLFLIFIFLNIRII